MKNLKPIKVLIVDDEERFRSTTKEILDRRGFQTTAVASGAEALEQLRNNGFDVIILDVKMPGMDGNEALRQIKSIDPDIAVIMLTGHGTPDSAVAGLRDGIFDYLSKPCNIEFLTKKIHQAYAGRNKVSDEESRVGDIMVPLGTFSKIFKNATVSQAMGVIIDSFNRSMFSGTVAESVHRSILVLDERDNVIGLLSFIDLLSGVQPSYMRLLKDRPVMADSIHIEPPDFTGLFTILVRDLGQKKVSDLMSAAPPAIRPQDNLMTAVNRILTLGVRRLLVVDDSGQAVGVIREQDLFFEIADIMRKLNGFS